MHAVSDSWAPALTSAHGIDVRADIVYGGSAVAEDVLITGGSITVDRGSAVRRTGSITIPEPSAFPFGETDLFSPYGHRAFVRAGLRYTDGSVELVSLGSYVVTAVGGDIHYGPLTVTLAGLEVLVQAAPFDTATSTSGSAASFISAQLAAVDDDFDFVDDSTDGAELLATRTWDAGADRWAALQEVALSVGAELFCDANGTFRLADIPDPGDPGPIDWDIASGDAGVMISASRSISADGVYNRVVVRGENAADNVAPVWGAAEIDDPLDPLRFGGPYGRRTLNHSTSLATSAARAEVIARAMLRQRRALNITATLEAVPNFALDAGDTVRAGYATQVPELHMVQSFTVPLSVEGSMSIATITGPPEVALASD